MLSRRRRSVRYLSGPQLPLLVQTVDEPGRQPDVVPHHRPVVSQPVHGADASTQISVDHRSQFTVSELRDRRHVRPRVCVCVCVCVWVSVCVRESVCVCVCVCVSTLMFCRFQHVSLMFTLRSNVTQQRLKNLEHTNVHINTHFFTSSFRLRRVVCSGVGPETRVTTKKKKITAQIHITLSHLLSG